MKKSRNNNYFFNLKSIFIKIATLVSFFLCNLCCYSQNDTTNLIDDQNQKQGYWVFTNLQKKLPGYKPKQKVEEGYYLDNRKQGKWTFYHRNGKRKHILYYENGIPDGKAIFYYKNGTIRETGTWRNNRWVGKYKQYYENGNPKNLFNYDKRGLKNGKQIYFHENGKPSLVGTWNNGDETDDLAEYLKDGTANTERYEAGPNIVVRNTGDSIRLDTLLNNEDSLNLKIRKYQKSNAPLTPFNGNGYHEFRDKNGNKTKVGEFEDGLLVNGKIFKYDEKGKLMLTKLVKDRAVVKVIRE